MIELCREAGLPEPGFEQRTGSFITTLYRNWLTDEFITKLGLNNRQKQALGYLKVKREITNREYQQLTGAIDQTSLRDLRDLLAFGLVEKIGKTGRGTRYRLKNKPDKNPTNPTGGAWRNATRPVGGSRRSNKKGVISRMKFKMR